MKSLILNGDYNYNYNFGENDENMKLIKKYINLSVIKEFKIIKFDNDDEKEDEEGEEEDGERWWKMVRRAR